MTGAPGSLIWLLAHELRVGWRRSGLATRPGVKHKRNYLGIAVFILVALLLQMSAFRLARELMSLTLEAQAATLAPLSLGLLILWVLEISHALDSSTQAIYLRGDLDLLLSSPLPPRRVLTIRALAIAVNVGIVYAALTLPLIIALMRYGQWHWLAFYPLLASLCLSGAALGLGLCMALFALIGPKRTRMIAQVMGALIGALIFLVSQSQTLLPASWRVDLESWSLSPGASELVNPLNPLWWPARALIGELWPMLACLAVALVMFVAAINLLGPRFVANVGAAAGAPASKQAPARACKHRFAPDGIDAAMLRKEWRLLVRDPWLISQSLMQALYLLPICFAFAGGGSPANVLAPAIVMIAGNLSSGLTWIAVRGEDAPDLVATAPLTARRLRIIKLVAALTPVIILLAVPLAAIAALSASAALYALLGAIVAAVSSALLCLFLTVPGSRKDFGKMHKRSIASWLLELSSQVAWSATVGLVISASALGFLTAAAGLLVLGGTWLKTRARKATILAPQKMLASALPLATHA